MDTAGPCPPPWLGVVSTRLEMALRDAVEQHHVLPAHAEERDAALVLHRIATALMKADLAVPTLPGKVVAEVGTHMDMRSLCTAQLVCRTWNEALSGPFWIRVAVQRYASPLPPPPPELFEPRERPLGLTQRRNLPPPSMQQLVAWRERDAAYDPSGDIRSKRISEAERRLKRETCASFMVTEQCICRSLPAPQYFSRIKYAKVRSFITPSQLNKSRDTRYRGALRIQPASV